MKTVLAVLRARDRRAPAPLRGRRSPRSLPPRGPLAAPVWAAAIPPSCAAAWRSGLALIASSVLALVLGSDGHRPRPERAAARLLFLPAAAGLGDLGRQDAGARLLSLGAGALVLLPALLAGGPSGPVRLLELGARRRGTIPGLVFLLLGVTVLALLLAANASEHDGAVALALAPARSGRRSRRGSLVRACQENLSPKRGRAPGQALPLPAGGPRLLRGGERCPGHARADRSPPWASPSLPHAVGLPGWRQRGFRGVYSGSSTSSPRT